MTLKLYFSVTPRVTFVTPTKVGVQSKMNNLNYFVYIMTNKRNGTLYIGVTNDLKRRVYEHKEKLVGGFTKNYNLKNLVYYELHNNPKAAIKREKQLKEWKRLWKLKLIEEKNPEWIDLYYEI